MNIKDNWVLILPNEDEALKVYDAFRIKSRIRDFAVVVFQFGECQGMKKKINRLEHKP